MIKVDRSEINPISVELQNRASEILAEYNALGELQRRQHKIRLDKIWHPIRRQVIPALLKMFEGKCAYCESVVGLSDTVSVDHFRPPFASDLDGSGALAHYQWLWSEWANYYLVCSACNRAKRGLFPVNGARAKIGTPADVIHLAEFALLVDPCIDEPREHLDFTSDGAVVGITEKGLATIKVLNLNREPLRAARRLAWLSAEARIQLEYSFSGLEQTHPYLAVIRKVEALASGVKETPAQPLELLAPSQIDSAEKSRLNERPLKKIRIRNFKMIRNLDLELPPAAEFGAPCLAILGENSSGKSTLLQAIALALVGADKANQVALPRRVLRRGAQEGFVELEFWDFDVPVRLSFNRRNPKFLVNDYMPGFVLAFGALRRVIKTKRTIRDESSASWVEGLFQPVTKMAAPEAWLAILEGDRFNAAARALKDILPSTSEMVLVKYKKRVSFEHDGIALTFDEISAGYQVMIGIACSVISAIFERWESLESASGLVLIDEIDAHLHPSWKLRVMGALRSAFPNIQFIVTTHDPLVLRGMKSGEVVVMRRSEVAESIVDINLPAIDGMQIDEILTSKVFGLDTTLSAEVEDMFDEYYHLLASDRSDGNCERLEELKSKLKDKETLGRNDRESMMLRAAADFVSGHDAQVDLTQARDDRLSYLRKFFE